MNVVRLLPRELRRTYKSALQYYIRDEWSRAKTQAHMLNARAIDIDEPLARAASLEILAIIEREQGAPDDAIRYLGYAEQLLEVRRSSSSDRWFLGRIRLQLSEVLFALGSNIDALRYLDLAQVDLAGTVDGIRASHQKRLLEIQNLPEWKDRVSQCRSILSELEIQIANTAKREKERFDALFRFQAGVTSTLATNLVVYGTVDEAQEGYILVSGLAMTLGDLTPADFLRYTNIYWAIVNRADVDIRLLLRDGIVPKAWSLADRMNNDPFYRSRALYLNAVLAFQDGNINDAIVMILDCIGVETEVLTAMGSSAIREGSSDSLDAAYDFGIWLAIEIGDSRLACELLESSRLQSRPTSVQAALAFRPAQEDAEMGFSMADGASLRELLVESPISEYAFIAVEGTSRLYQRRHPPDVSVIELTHVIESVAGESAWWWAVRLQSGIIYWALRSPAGDWHSGKSAISPDAEPSLIRFASRYLANPELATLGNDRYLETEDAYVATKIVVPPKLLGVLRASDDPIRLVVSGNILSSMPLPTLSLSLQTDERLIERATIYVQPPAIFVHALTHSAVESEARMWPTTISCMDPTGDLPNSFHDTIQAQTWLVGANHTDDGRQLATTANLLGALQMSPKGAAGLFYFSGHSRDGRFGYDLESALALCDGDLTARTIIDSFATVSGSTGFPSRVFLSSCKSAGSPGSGAGQWLGLGAALLCSGARQITATVWNIPDAPETGRFETAFVAELREATDVAEALARLQRYYLEAWRSAVKKSERLRYSPAMWSAFQVIGVRV